MDEAFEEQKRPEDDPKMGNHWASNPDYNGTYRERKPKGEPKGQPRKEPKKNHVAQEKHNASSEAVLLVSRFKMEIIRLISSSYEIVPIALRGKMMRQ